MIKNRTKQKKNNHKQIIITNNTVCIIKNRTKQKKINHKQIIITNNTVCMIKNGTKPEKNLSFLNAPL